MPIKEKYYRFLLVDLKPQISEGYLTYAMLKTANLCLKWSPSLKNGWKNLDDD